MELLYAVLSAETPDSTSRLSNISLVSSQVLEAWLPVPPCRPEAGDRASWFVKVTLEAMVAICRSVD